MTVDLPLDAIYEFDKSGMFPHGDKVPFSSLGEDKFLTIYIYNKELKDYLTDNYNNLELLEDIPTNVSAGLL